MKLALADWLEEKMSQDPSLVLVTGDLGYRCFEKIQKQFPNQYINAGVAEQNMVGLAAGLAIEGFRPVVYSIAPFLLLRALEQIRNDIVFQKLPVILVGNGGGIGYGLQGSSHQCIEDLALMSLQAGLRSFFPLNKVDTRSALDRAWASQVPTYLRTTHELPEHSSFVKDLALAQKQDPAYPLRFFQGEELVLCALGSLGVRAYKVIKDQDLVERVSLFVFKEFPFQGGPALVKALGIAKCWAVIEEHQALGGLASQILHRSQSSGVRLPMRSKFISVDSYADDKSNDYYGLLEQAGLSESHIAEFIFALLEQKSPVDPHLQF